MPIPEGGSSLRIMGIETLSRSDRELAENYVLLCSGAREAKSVLVGIIKGPADWDIRPLLLAPSGGGLLLLRLFEAVVPEVGREITLGAGIEGLALLDSGEHEGRPWIRRRFFSKTLSERGEELSPSQILGQLVSLLVRLRDNNLVHGHLCLENLAVDHGRLFLMDYGFGRLARRAADLAPEVAAGAPHPSSDLWGFAKVAETLGLDYLNDEQRSCLAAILAAPPERRPPLEAVVASFAPPHRLKSPILGVEKIRTGKIISPTELERPPLEKQERTNVVSPIDRAVKSVQAEQKTDRQDAAEVQTVQGPIESTRGIGILAYSTLAVFLAALVLLAIRLMPSSDQTKLRWLSGVPEETRRVAVEALDSPGSEAWSVIVSDAQSGNDRPPARLGLLRTAFHPKWEPELQQGDLLLAMTLALTGLGVPTPENLPSLAEAHPGVQLAVIGDLSLKSSAGKFSDIAVSSLAGLPQPYGLAIAALDKSGATNFSEPSAQALAHLLTGDFSSEVLDAYLPMRVPDRWLESRLMGILPFASVSPGLIDKLTEHLHSRGDSFSERLKWFDEQGVVNWNKLPRLERLMFSSALFPAQELTLEQLSDLLTFPALRVRTEAGQQLEKLLQGRGIEGVVRFLAAGSHSLSRSQIVALLSALRIEGETGYAFVSKWFETNPDPQSVLELVLQYRRNGQFDALSVEGSRYLTTHEWTASDGQLASLASHPDPIARSLAYTRLDPNRPEHQQILHHAIKGETNKRLRDELARRLASVMPAR